MRQTGDYKKKIPSNRPVKTFVSRGLKEAYQIKKLNSVALVRERTIPTERPPPVGEVSANFCV